MDNQSAGPIIIESSANAGNHSQFKRNFSNQLPKLLFFVLAAVVAIEIVIGIRTLSKPLPPSLKVITTQSVGNLILITKDSTYKVGDIIPVIIYASTGGHAIAGLDAVVHFDNRLLEATGSSIVPASMFKEYPFVSVSQNLGVAALSGVSVQQQTTFNGAAMFAIINVKAKSIGTAELTLDFTPGKTDDSNMVEAGTSNDILGKITNLTVTIK